MRLGILGGGQLARMLILDGLRLNLSFRVYDKAPHPSTMHLAEFHQGDWDDEEALARFAEGLDVVTSEFENVPASTIDFLRKTVPCYPRPQSFAVAQDRLREKDLISSLGIKTTNYRSVDTEAELIQASEELGYPFVVKQRRLGYDGKGQSVVRNEAERSSAWKQLGGAALIAENFVSFDRELSIIGVFGKADEARFYPLVENEHRAGILYKSTAPALKTNAVESKARDIVSAIARACDY